MIIRFKEEQAEREQLIMKYERMKKEIISNEEDGAEIQVKLKRSLSPTCGPS